MHRLHVIGRNVETLASKISESERTGALDRIRPVSLPESHFRLA